MRERRAAVKFDGAVLDESQQALGVLLQPWNSLDQVLAQGFKFLHGRERIVIVEATEGKAKLVIPASDTAGFGWTEGVYDLLLIGPEKTTRVLEGKVTIAQGVTR